MITNEEMGLQIGLAVLAICCGSYALASMVSSGSGMNVDYIGVGTYVSFGLLAITLAALRGVCRQQVWGLYISLVLSLFASPFLVGIPLLYCLKKIDWDRYREYA